MLDFQREFPDAKVDPARAQLPLRAGASSTPPHAVVAPIEDARSTKKLQPARAAAAVRFWRCALERAQAQAVAAEVERLIAGRRAARGDLRAGALGQERGRRGGHRARGARDPVPAGRRGRLLPARRGARPARLAARCWPTRPTRAPWCARSSRPPIELRSVDVARLDAARAPAQARHGRGASRRRSRARSCSQEGRDRAQRVPAALPLAPRRAFEDRRPDAFVHPADRAHRPAPPAGVRHPRRHGRAAASTSPSSPSWPPPTCAASRRPRARDFARYLAAVAEAGLREEEAVGRAPSAGRAGDDDARAPRGSSSTTSSCSGCQPSRDARPAARARRRRCRTSCSRSSCRAGRPRAAHEAEMRRLLHVAMTRARKGLVLAWAETGAAGHHAAAVALLRGGARGARRRGGGVRGGAVRPRRGPALHLPHDARRAARHAWPASAGAWARCASTPTSTWTRRWPATSS